MNYIFFIGGSGARVYRAFLHACASGAIQTDAARVMLLDADSANAACKESCDLFRAYRDLREVFHSGGEQPEVPAFHCDVHMYRERPVSPVNDSFDHLGQVAGGNSVRTRALSWFYSEEERVQNLANGFYAHPNIGCMFFQNFGGNPYLQNCINDIAMDLSNDVPVHVIIVGSVFGGTGAAGIPSIQKVLMERLAGKNVPLKEIHFCGVLVTPYFKVAEKPEDAGPGIGIDSDDFYGNTRTALIYYRFADQFERIYLVGQNTLDVVNRKYADGGKAQENKPHIVEVFAAMAVKRFLDGETEDETILWMMLDRSDSGKKITWESFDKDACAMADMLRAQALLETAIYPCISRKKGMYQWYKVYDLDSSDRRKGLGPMQDYSGAFLTWMYHLQSRYSNSSDELCADTGIKLGGPDVLKELWECVENRKKDAGGTPEHEKRGWRQYQEDFNNLVTTAENVKKVKNVTVKVIDILSGLGLNAKKLADFGFPGLFVKLFGLVRYIAS